MNVYCAQCGRQHAVQRPQAYQPERVTLREIVDLTLFWLAMLGSLWVWLAIMAAGQS